MNSKKFFKLLKELKQSKPSCDYWLELFYKGNEIGCIYGEGDIDSIEVDERSGYVLVHTDTFGMCVDNAEINSY